MKDSLPSIREIRRIVKKLAVEIGPRPPGSQEEKTAALWIGGELEKLGLPTVIESFETPASFCSESALTVAGKKFKSVPVQFSPAGKISGEIVFLGNEDMSGQIEFTPGAVGILMPMSGLLSRHKTVIDLEEKGLGALVVVSSMGDTVNGKIVREPGLRKMPVVSVTNDIAELLVKNAGKKAKLTVTAKSSVSPGSSQNVIATIKGTGPLWMVVCAHCDTAAATPGAMDNAGGVAVLMEVARQLQGMTPEATIHFVISGCEEYGTEYYTGRGMLDFFSRRRADLKNCICLVDIDEIGHKIGTPTLYVGGPRPFRETVKSEPALMRRLTVERWSSDGGDNGAAYQFGVPHVWYYDHSMNTYYHSPKDTIRHFDSSKAVVITKDLTCLVRRLSSCGMFIPFVRKGDLMVRPARYEDIPMILEITEKAFKPVSLARMRQDFFGKPLGGKEWNVYKKKDVEGFCRRNNYQIIVAEFAGKIVGYATWSFDQEQGIAEICNNAVHPEHQGRGIGKAMQTEIERRMREEGYTRFTVTTLSVDIPAQKLYEKLGYSRYAESIHYLRRD